MRRTTRGAGHWMLEKMLLLVLAWVIAAVVLRVLAAVIASLLAVWALYGLIRIILRLAR